MLSSLLLTFINEVAKAGCPSRLATRRYVAFKRFRSASFPPPPPALYGTRNARQQKPTFAAPRKTYIDLVWVFKLWGASYATFRFPLRVSAKSPDACDLSVRSPISLMRLGYSSLLFTNVTSRNAKAAMELMISLCSFHSVTGFEPQPLLTYRSLSNMEPPIF